MLTLTRNRALIIGIAATLIATLLWHGPGGAGEGLAVRQDQRVRAMLDHYEMQQVSNRMQRSPLMRRMIFAGSADDFQRTEIVRMTEEVPGIAEARWNRPRSLRLTPLPLIVEAMIAALVAFATGCIVSYIFALRARNPY